MARRAVAEVNLAAIERNAELLRGRIPAHTQLCAVVKANGYGHGAVQVAGAALRGGATVLAVVTSGEAGELRRAGLDAPILVLGAHQRRGAAGSGGRGCRADGLGPGLRGTPAPTCKAVRRARSGCMSSSIPAWDGWARATWIRRLPPCTRCSRRRLLCVWPA